MLEHPAQKLITTIIHLGKELQHENSVPQVTLSLQEQRLDILRFTVILVRLLKNGSYTPSLQELSKLLPRKVCFIPIRVANIDATENLLKEANVFRLDVESASFVQNQLVDLDKAYQFVVDALTKMIGPFKDCTADFLPKTPHPTNVEKELSGSQVLNIHLPRPAQSFDPRSGFDRTSGIVIKMLYEGLCRVSESNQIEMGVAEKVEVSEDKKIYTFILKPTFWSDGTPLTAYDFEFSWKKALEPDFPSPYSFLFFPIKNAEAAKKGEMPHTQIGIHALNQKTLQIHLEFPTPYFLDLTASWSFSPLYHGIDQKYPGWSLKTDSSYLCNGPFKFEKRFQDGGLHLVKNELYWDAPSVNLSHIKIAVIDKASTALEIFHQGKTDWVGDPINKIAPVDIPGLKEKNLLFTHDELSGLFWLQLNINQFPLQNAHIRKALSYGTNRKELLKNILFSDEVSASGINIQQGLINPLFEEHTSSCGLAVDFFRRGLEELNLSLADLPPFIISHSDIEEHEAISHALGKQWGDLFGIKVKYEKHPWNTYFTLLHRNEHMIGGITWFTRFSDPIYFFDLLVFKEHAIRTTTWRDANYFKLVEEAKHTSDQAKKIACLEQAEKILLDAMPVIPLFYQKFRYIKNPKLKGYILSNTNQIDFRAAYFEEENYGPP